LDGDEFLFLHDSMITDNKNMYSGFRKYFISSKVCVGGY
jgi:hypothetical protein